MALEGVLGFEKVGDLLRIDPCIPSEWDGFALEYRYGESVYAIEVQNPEHVSGGVAALTIDGVASTNGHVALANDGMKHTVSVVLGRLTAAPAEIGSAAERSLQ